MSAVLNVTAEWLSGRDLALLRAVAGGRAELTCSCEPDLFIDGRCCCDQFAAHRLARAGLIQPATPGALGQRVPAELTRARRRRAAPHPTRPCRGVRPEDEPMTPTSTSATDPTHAPAGDTAVTEQHPGLDGPVHRWFGLGYSTHQVLPRVLMQSMPRAWQERMVACLSALRDAFDHVDQPQCYLVRAAVEREIEDLDDQELLDAGCARHHDDGDPDGDPGGVYVDVDGTGCVRHGGEDSDPDRGDRGWVYLDSDGTEREGWERVLVPVRDLPPPYDRGRPFISPRGPRPVGPSRGVRS